MTNGDTYRDQLNAELHTAEPGGYGRPPEKSVREIPPPPGLMLTAMLSRRVRVPLEGGGTQWMSGYDALASVLGERSAAGDTRAAMLLASLNRYAALSPKDLRLPRTVAPGTEAERALATAFVRRVAAGLQTDEPDQHWPRPALSRAVGRKERHNA